MQSWDDLAEDGGSEPAPKDLVVADERHQKEAVGALGVVLVVHRHPSGLERADEVLAVVLERAVLWSTAAHARDDKKVSEKGEHEQ